MNYAPAVDLNTNPLNPIIGNRSFGEDPQAVSEAAEAFYSGMWSAGVMGSIKHFPGTWRHLSRFTPCIACGFS
jgi:beta-glucosidase-like glycosyl hydrolase